MKCCPVRIEIRSLDHLYDFMLCDEHPFNNGLVAWYAQKRNNINNKTENKHESPNADCRMHVATSGSDDNGHRLCIYIYMIRPFA